MQQPRVQCFFSATTALGTVRKLTVYAGGLVRRQHLLDLEHDQARHRSRHLIESGDGERGLDCPAGTAGRYLSWRLRRLT